MGYRIVRTSTELFTMLMTQGHQIPNRSGERLRVTKGLPEGAKLESVSVDLYFMFGEVAMRWSHPSWEPVPSGQAIPELRIEFVMETWPEPASEALIVEAKS